MRSVATSLVTTRPGEGPSSEPVAGTRLGRPGVAKALLGKAALPDDLPWVTGS